MTYQFVTTRTLLKESSEKAMTVLGEAYEAARDITSRDSRAEALAEIGRGYAMVAQAAAEAIEETA